MSEASSYAAILASELLGEFEGLDHDLGLRLSFSAETCGYPDENGIHFPVTVTREALYEGGEWKWTLATRRSEMSAMTTTKRRESA